jgi:hypothetical protein
MTAHYVNGIDATSGEYLLPPVEDRDVAEAAQALVPGQVADAALRGRHHRVSERHYAPKHGVDGRDLAQAGWAVVAAADADPAVLTALRPLLEHRQRQAGAVAERRYRVLAGEDGYRTGESKQDFQARFGVGPGPVDPDVLPYHLLLVGSPEEIPFDVQYQLDVQHSVGRLSFDSVDDYRRYAVSVLAAESSPLDGAGSRRLCAFAPRNAGDPATDASVSHLATPLVEDLRASLGSWEIASLFDTDATKANLVSTLTGDQRPDVLFTASHGVGYPAGHAAQRAGQGALLCQDWPGPGKGPVRPEHLFAATDVRAAPDLDLTGMVAVLFACFGAGTPVQDDFGRARGERRTLSPTPFVAALPQALLGREGGALAVLGHVDRAWGCSFLWPGAGSQTEVFRSSLARLADGEPVGSALEYMGDRHAEIATELARALEMIELGKRADHELLARLWTAYADARNFVVLGDPAVRLRQQQAPPSPEPTTERATVLAPPPGEPSAGPDDLEVATYVADDPESVAVDAATGTLKGARLHLYSRIRPDGSATHVVARDTPFATGDAEREKAVTEIHARLLEVSLAARQLPASATTRGVEDD